jgi:hypothetical protein
VFTLSFRYALSGYEPGLASAAVVPGTATRVYAVYEMMNEGDLEQHLPHPAPSAPGMSGLTDMERLTVRAGGEPGIGAQARHRVRSRLVVEAPGICVCASESGVGAYALAGRESVP